ncbi:DedA family protein [Pandoraea pulmonicola]|uniref:SNARE associated Golgi protein n=1 Tax=Pandoraea pulmonicola TaxID=93221 RepID=A0AAJ5D2A2_PANPU|nr:VTT domain-containing protein [Pandoraea pulmonicola]AJC19466.1 hypothetical protein RO07_01310 [Pandoraea pulmonicola]SUA92497.1 SNARE associated Golgi protein [Pandoraea pulmonicola]
MSPAELSQLFMGYGLLGGFAIGLLEKLVPIAPSYLVLMFLGFVEGSAASLSMLILASALGSLAGTMVWYLVGRCVGEGRVSRLVGRYGRYVHFSTATYDHLVGSFRRNARVATFVGQLIPVVRLYLALPAGVLRIGMGRFVPSAAAGILIYNAIFMTIGFVLRGSAHEPLSIGGWVMGVLAGMEITGLILANRWAAKAKAVDCRAPASTL